MTDHASPNLPSRDFDETVSFYAGLGFRADWRDEEWLIVSRGDLKLEFFPHPHLDPSTNWFSCCLRVDDVGALYAAFAAAGIPEKRDGWPRLQALATAPWGGLMGALVDPDGTLLRLIQN